MGIYGLKVQHHPAEQADVAHHGIVKTSLGDTERLQQLIHHFLRIKTQPNSVARLVYLTPPIGQYTGQGVEIRLGVSRLYALVVVFLHCIPVRRLLPQ